MNYEIVIGFETHVALRTMTKLFCDCPVKYETSPNSQICPVCTGQPGALPVLNKKAVEDTVRAGLAMHCTINERARFARKNYFYPDLPKGYQISQNERPFCENGRVEIPSDNGRSYAVGIKRIHLEEDAGKLVHSSSSFEASDYSLVDYNRSGVPLIEIVTDHERNPLRSAGEARIYLETLRRILTSIGVSDCIIEKGQFRSDVNVSLRPKGSGDFGNRSETKNMTSFRFITDALEYEIRRQSKILQSGGEPSQETRLFDEAKKITMPMRSKEDAPDYRYFPDPDLVEIAVDQEFVKRIESTMPELPDETVNRITGEYGVSRNDAVILARHKNVLQFFERCVSYCDDRKSLSRWIIRDLFELLSDASQTIEDCRVEPKAFSELINLVSQGDITARIGKAVLKEMFTTGGSARAIVEEKGLRPIQDTDVLAQILDAVIAENPDAVSQIREGMTKPINFLIGRVMKETMEKANPNRIRELIRAKLLV